MISKIWMREFRVLIKHHFMKSKSPQETKEMLDKHYSETAPWIRRVCQPGICTKEGEERRKVMANICWNSQGIIFIDYLEKCKTIIAAYYASLLYRLKTEL